MTNDTSRQHYRCGSTLAEFTGVDTDQEVRCDALAGHYPATAHKTDGLRGWDGIEKPRAATWHEPNAADAGVVDVADRLAEIVEELEQFQQDAEDAGVPAVWMKLEEALGPLRSAQLAARTAVYE